ncbi:phosphatase PAP2 family protein [Hyphomicrobium sp. MC8b]|uniref:phosphatase PAP2 family protein n=1 Tax=Hyphomicrobium sp. MC8b TaxID=300273 RepID=UPI00391975A3
MPLDNAEVWKSNQASAADVACAPAKAMLFGAVAFGICLMIFYLAYPRFDLSVSRALYVQPHRFIGSESLFFGSLRKGFSTLFCAVCVLAGVGCVVSLISMRKRWLSLSASQWLYLAVCLLIGPLTIANLGFKDHWGRPRPNHVMEFGGSKIYAPPLKPSDQCIRNCSFFSGEASSIYIICFAAAFLFPADAAFWTLSGVVLGTLAGFVRMAEGGHFLSDVAFAGVFMALTASAIHMLFAVVGGRYSD